MDVKDKIISALRSPLSAAYIRLEDDEGISGFVVSDRFAGMSTLDRQRLIDDTLNSDSSTLTPEERRRVLMIAGLTPVEYDAVGANIIVHKVKKLSGGAIEVLVQGGWSDAEYVRGSLKGLKGVQTTEPRQVSRPGGALMAFRATGPEATPLTKDKVVRILQQQTYVTVMPGA